jgi:cardiolipin synthase
MPRPPPQDQVRPRFLEAYGLTLANGVTAARLVLVPFIVVSLLRLDFASAFWLTVVAGLTDAVDGFVARVFGHKSRLGAYLDPIADKVLILTLFGVLTFEGHLPLWLVLFAFARDAAIVTTVAIFTRMGTQGLRMQPLFISKVNTAAQVGLIIATLADLAFAGDWSALRQALVWMAALTTLVSWAAYFREGLRALRRRDSQSEA